MKKIYFAILMLLFIYGSTARAQSNQDTPISLSQEKMNVFFSNTEDMIRLSYTMSASSPVEIKIVDITGKQIKAVNFPMQFSGSYSDVIERNGLREGIYILEMTFSGRRFIKRFIIS